MVHPAPYSLVNEKCIWINIDRSTGAKAQSKIFAIPQALFCATIKAIYHLACAIFCGIEHLLTGNFKALADNFKFILLDFKQAIAHLYCLGDYESGTLVLHKTSGERFSLQNHENFDGITIEQLLASAPERQKRIFEYFNLDLLCEFTQITISDLLSILYLQIPSARLLILNTENLQQSELFKILTKKSEELLLQPASVDWSKGTYLDLLNASAADRSTLLKTLDLEFTLKLIDNFFIKLSRLHPQILKSFPLNKLTQEEFLKTDLCSLLTLEFWTERLHEFIQEGRLNQLEAGSIAQAEHNSDQKKEQEFCSRILSAIHSADQICKQWAANFISINERSAIMDFNHAARQLLIGELLITPMKDSRFPLFFLTTEELNAVKTEKYSELNEYQKETLDALLVVTPPCEPIE